MEGRARLWGEAAGFCYMPKNSAAQEASLRRRVPSVSANTLLGSGMCVRMCVCRCLLLGSSACTAAVVYSHIVCTAEMHAWRAEAVTYGHEPPLYTCPSILQCLALRLILTQRILWSIVRVFKKNNIYNNFEHIYTYLWKSIHLIANIIFNLLIKICVNTFFLSNVMHNKISYTLHANLYERGLQ